MISMRRGVLRAAISRARTFRTFIIFNDSYGLDWGASSRLPWNPKRKDKFNLRSIARLLPTDRGN
jgi:hypothetical protein